jgi:hypothetical protein
MAYSAAMIDTLCGFYYSSSGVRCDGFFFVGEKLNEVSRIATDFEDADG